MSQPISTALISTDDAFREMLSDTLAGHAREFTVGADLSVPISGIGNVELKALREARPELVFLDFTEEPEMAARFARFLTEKNPEVRFIAAGPMLSSNILMDAMRAGVNEYLTKPVTGEAITESLERILRKLAHAAGGAAAAAAPIKEGEVFSVFSAKGGAGTTTVATNLAVELCHLTGRKTLLLDLDLEMGEASMFLGMQPRFNFVDMIGSFHRMDAELLGSYIEQHDSGVHLLSAPFHPETAEGVTGEQVGKVLRFLKQHYEYVVVDTAKSFSPATLATLERADRIFLVTTVDLPSLRNIKRSLPLLERVTGGDRDRLRLVVNRYQSSDAISLEEVKQTLGIEVYHTLANDYAVVSESINAGKPVARNAAAAFARDLKALAARITGVGPATNGKRSPIDSIRKLFGRKQEVSSHE